MLAFDRKFDKSGTGTEVTKLKVFPRKPGENKTADCFRFFFIFFQDIFRQLAAG